MDAMINNQLNKFCNSDGGTDETLQKLFVNYMNDLVMTLNTRPSMQNINNEQKEKLFLNITNQIIDSSLQEKMNKLIEDTNYNRLLQISNQLEEMTHNVYLNGIVYDDNELNSLENEIHVIKNGVFQQNIESAKSLISECFGDLMYLKDPDSKFCSFRLSRFIRDHKLD